MRTEAIGCAAACRLHVNHQIPHDRIQSDAIRDKVLTGALERVHSKVQMSVCVVKEIARAAVRKTFESKECFE